MIVQKYFSFYKKGISLIPLGTALLLSEVLVRKGIVPSFLFPAPSQVFHAYVQYADYLKGAFFQTLQASLFALGFCVLFGIGSAMLLAASSTLRNIFYPYTVFFQTVPIIAIAPLLVVWLGFGISTVVASGFVVALFPMISSTLTGLTSTDPNLLLLFKSLKAKPLQNFLKLRFPYSLPYVLNGLKISSGLAVIGCIVGEFISGTGLGGLIDEAKNQQNVELIFAALGLASVLGLFFFLGVSYLNYIFLKNWHPEYQNKN